MRILILPALLALAACAASERADAPAADTIVPPAVVALAPGQPDNAHRIVPRPGGDPPDFNDPRAMTNLDPLDWAAWETVPPEGRAARLRTLGIEPIRTGTGADSGGERVEDFHFIDFTGDGVEDVIYQGPWFERTPAGVDALEGTVARMFQVADGRATQVGRHSGGIQRIWRGRPGEAISYRVYSPGCCAEPEWSVEYLRAAERGPPQRWFGYHKLVGRADLRMPTRFWDTPRRFTVASEGYVLRATPQVKDRVGPGEEDWFTWDGRGNVLAEYARGARGTAYAEATDSTGRVWWFVRMDGFTRPRAAQTMEIQDHGEYIIPNDRLGWMSSRYLTPAP